MSVDVLCPHVSDYCPLGDGHFACCYTRHLAVQLTEYCFTCTGILVGLKKMFEKKKLSQVDFGPELLGSIGFSPFFNPV